MTRFLVQALPGGFEAGPPRAMTATVSAPELSPGLLERLAAWLRATAPGLRDRPVAEMVTVLGGVGERFLDDDDPVRREALDRLPSTSGLSPAMARAVLDGMAADWTRSRLKRLVEEEFGDPDALDRPIDRGGRRALAVGPELCTQIVSGTVPGVGVAALLRSLLVKGPTLLKPGLGDSVLPVLFARGLAEADPHLAESVAVLYWPGGSPALEHAAVGSAEVAVVYGSDSTVAAVRATAPATVRVVAYHHRTSACILGNGLSDAEADVAAADVARAVVMFDRRGCVCPQDVFVERGGTVSPSDLARRIAVEMEKLDTTLPAGSFEIEEAAAMRQFRDYAELRAASGEGELHQGPGGPGWAVLLDRSGDPAPPGVARCIRVTPVDDLDDVVPRLTPVARHLQTVGHAGLGSRVRRIGEALGRLGASRIVPIRDMAFPPPWWLHDGRAPLGELVRWVELATEG